MWYLVHEALDRAHRHPALLLLHLLHNGLHLPVDGEVGVVVQAYVQGLFDGKGKKRRWENYALLYKCTYVVDG